MRLTGIYQNDTKLRNIFSWLTRIGAGRKFGSLPIGWYQIHQCHCLDKLKELLARYSEEDCDIRCSDGMIQVHAYNGTWINLISSNDLFKYADDMSRR